MPPKAALYLSYNLLTLNVEPNPTYQLIYNYLILVDTFSYFEDDKSAPW